ncbi:Holliday junction branch migration DNA helicase RuvB [Candidatus Dojkabacteria bacterium]|uniref:Holliday junction branch migration complex subunit RuvB n=1 Tax=Candidatus Dojkabacteria bacterium TaxID=2099670 RepID=A0A955I587_9BACT|nr:Holliday junction branch migration DNA helicase RuvB [Candidatus Dojkabacteria bacterium]
MSNSSNVDSHRIVSSSLLSDSEEQVENNLRPDNFTEVIGRKREKDNLQVMIQSALQRDAALDHILFHGPPGLGKTSLAMVVAKEMGVPFHITTGPAINKAGDLASILTTLEDRSILFIDEIHRLRHAVEEILYPAMEDRAIDLVIGKGPSAKTLRLDLPQFTIVGATTKMSMLSAPLRDRFGVDFRLDFYDNGELEEIVQQKARKMELQIEPAAAAEIASRARMTARIAVRILKRVRDLAVVSGKDVIDTEHVMQALEMLDIDSEGLDMVDRKILHSIYYKFANKPVGLNTLAASISEEPATVEDVYEPFLLRKGLLERTPRGRALTASGIEYMLNFASEVL